MKLTNRFTKRIGFRLSAAYLAIFLFSAASFFAVHYILIAHTFEQNDLELLDSRLSQFASVYASEGVPGLERLVSDRKQWANGPRLFVRLQAKTGKVLFFHLPEQSSDFTPEEIRAQTDLPYPPPDFMKLTSKADSEDVLEISARPLPDGSILQIGKDTDDREENLNQFRKIFLMALIPWLVVGIFVGWYFSKRTLKPIRTFIETIRSIQSGDLGARAPRSGYEDELDELTVVFNRMLDKNDRLIEGMRTSLDAISHDMKTPMTRILGLGERAVRSSDLQDKNDALSEVIESSSEIMKLLNHILEVAEAESGALKLKPIAFVNSELLEQMQDLYEIVAEERGIQIEIRSDDTIFEADMRFKQVLANLLDNAIKYSPDNAKIALRSYGLDENIFFEVEDHGPGIAEIEIPKIWQRLYRGDGSRSTKGTGLGLNLVRSIVEAHGGRVTVDTSLGHGSIFRVAIPLTSFEN